MFRSIERCSNLHPPPGFLRQRYTSATCCLPEFPRLDICSAPNWVVFPHPPVANGRFQLHNTIRDAGLFCNIRRCKTSRGLQHTGGVARQYTSIIGANLSHTCCWKQRFAETGHRAAVDFDPLSCCPSNRLPHFAASRNYCPYLQRPTEHMRDNDRKPLLYECLIWFTFSCTIPGYALTTHLRFARHWKVILRCRNRRRRCLFR